MNNDMEIRLEIYDRMLSCPFGKRQQHCPYIFYEQWDTKAKLDWLNRQDKLRIHEYHDYHKTCYKHRSFREDLKS